MTTTEKNFPDILRTRLTIYAASALLAMAVCAGLTVGIPLLAHWKHMENASLRQKAEIKAMAVAEWLRQNKHLARQLAARTGMRQELEALNTGQKSKEEVVPFITGAIQDSLHQSSDVIGITRFNHKGILIASGGMELSPTLLPLLQGSPDRVRISPPITLDGQQVLLLAAPIRNRANKYIGSDLIAVSTANLAPLLQNNAALGMLNQENILWFNPERIPTFYAAFWDAALIRGVNHLRGVEDYEEEVLAYVPVPDSPWALVLSEDSAALYAPAWTQVKGMAATMTIVYFICLGGFMLVSRPLAGKILMHTHELESSIDAKTKQLQNELQARTRAELNLQKARDELERRVVERTRRLAEANLALQKEQVQRKEVARELINLLEKVRSDISRDLHDHTGQLLTTLRLSLETLRNELTSIAPIQTQKIQLAGNTVQTIQQSLKNIAKGLRPPCLDYLGLVPEICFFRFQKVLFAF